VSDRLRLYAVSFLFAFGISGILPTGSVSSEPFFGLKGSASQGMQTNLISLPPYVKNIPKDHFVGISTPRPSLAEARQAAIDDAKRQVLSSMGSNYRHSYVDHSSGNVISGKIERTVGDDFRNDSQGFLVRIESSIVDSHWITDEPGNYICFVLIRCSEKMIRDMQRLSRGARVVAKLETFDENRAVVELTECNNVWVTFVRATVSVTYLRKWAKAVTLFLWCVAEKADMTYEIPLSPFRIGGRMRKIPIDLADPAQRNPLFISTSSRYLKIILHGFDEMGRVVMVSTGSLN
jgi:hypothetical protein